MYFFEKEKCLNYHFVYFSVVQQNLKCKFDIIHNDIRSEFRIKSRIDIEVIFIAYVIVYKYSKEAR